MKHYEINTINNIIITSLPIFCRILYDAGPGDVYLGNENLLLRPNGTTLPALSRGTGAVLYSFGDGFAILDVSVNIDTFGCNELNGACLLYYFIKIILIIILL